MFKIGDLVKVICCMQHKIAISDCAFCEVIGATGTIKRIGYQGQRLAYKVTLSRCTWLNFFWAGELELLHKELIDKELSKLEDHLLF